MSELLQPSCDYEEKPRESKEARLEFWHHWANEPTLEAPPGNSLYVKM